MYLSRVIANHLTSVLGGIRPRIQEINPMIKAIAGSLVIVLIIVASNHAQQTSDGDFFSCSPAEHEVLGSPSNAVANINSPNDYLIERAQYVLSYNREKGEPNWVAWHLDSTWIGLSPRQNDYRADSSLPIGWYQVQATDYSGSGFDRGHNCPSGDRTSTVADNSATFRMTNLIPQAPDNNQGPWEFLESYCRTLALRGYEMYIYMGGAGSGGTGSNGGVTDTIANGRVNVPEYTWKVVLVLPNGANDLSRIDENTRVFAVIMPNTQGIRTDPWQKYLATVDQVEALTGYDFFANVSPGVQSVIESRFDPASNTSPQVLPGGYYDDLDISSPNTSIAGNVTVSGNLRLGGSTLTTGSGKITLGPNAVVSRISGFVNGALERQYVTPTLSLFPVGTRNGYSPVTVNVTSIGRSPSSLTVTAIDGPQPSVVDPGMALKRFWRLNETGDLTASLTFKYNDRDLPAGTSEANLRLNRYDDGFSEFPAKYDLPANTVTATGISHFSDWTLLPSIERTAATAVSVSGRILAPDGHGLKNAWVSFIDGAGNLRRTSTSMLGYYRFDMVTAGQTVVLTVISKSFRFTPRTLMLNDDLNDVDLKAENR